MEPITVYRVSDCPHNREHHRSLIGKLYESHPVGVVCFLYQMQIGDVALMKKILYNSAGSYTGEVLMRKVQSGFIIVE